MNNNRIKYLFYLLGILILLYSFFILFNSHDLTYAAKPSDENLILYIIVRIVVGMIYTAAVVLIIRKRLVSKKNLLFIFLIGLIARLILVPTEPIQEDDFYRYLWDGAVTANGYNPYEYPPIIFIERDSTSLGAPQKLFDLADSSGKIINQINHPKIRSIYPPVAQIAFYIAYLIKPWNVTVWKILLLILDLIVFYLSLLVLKKMNFPLTLILIYWWNPILLHEIFNVAHMDLIMYPLIVGAILYYLKDRLIISSSLFAIAVGAKIWPIVFIPFILKMLIKKKKDFVRALLITSGIILILFLPIIITKLDNSSGFIAYGKNWTNNESVFRLIDILIKQFISFFQINYYCSLCAARWVVILIYAGLVIIFLRNREKREYDLIIKFFYLVAVMFLISPTQFPWYYTWVLPFLVLSPRISFVAYAIFLPLYHLHYSQQFIVWLEHIPILILFTLELIYPQFGNYLTPKISE